MKKLLSILLALLVVAGVAAAGTVGAGAGGEPTPVEKWAGDNGYLLFAAFDASGNNVIGWTFAGGHMKLMLEWLCVSGNDPVFANTYVGVLQWEETEAKLEDGTLAAHAKGCAAQNDAILLVACNDRFTSDNMQAAEQYALDMEEFWLLVSAFFEYEFENLPEQAIGNVYEDIRSQWYEAWDTAEEFAGKTVLGIVESESKWDAFWYHEDAINTLWDEFLDELCGEFQATFDGVFSVPPFSTYEDSLAEYRSSGYEAINNGCPTREGYGLLPELRDAVSGLKQLTENTYEDVYEAAQAKLVTFQATWDTRLNALLAEIRALLDVEPPTPPSQDKILSFFASFLPSGVANVFTFIVKYLFFGWLWGQWL